MFQIRNAANEPSIDQNITNPTGKKVPRSIPVVAESGFDVGWELVRLYVAFKALLVVNMIAPSPIAGPSKLIWIDFADDAPL